MKKYLAASLLSVATLTQAQAAPSNLDTLDKELEIMSGVIDTALKQNNDRKGMRYRSVDTTYLSRQGVVFTVYTRNRGGFNISLGDIFSNVPEAPMPPVAVISGDGDFEFSVGQDWEVFADEVTEQVNEAFRESNQQLRELRHQERELAWERREMERRKRDLEFELRQADNDREKEIRQELEEVKKDMSAFTAKEKDLEKFANELEKEQREKLNERKEAQMQAYKAFLAGFESSVGDTLCRFGAGLRGLPDKENITFVLKDFSASESQKRKDRIYVFAKANVISCVQEKTDVSKLLSSADVYEF